MLSLHNNKIYILEHSQSCPYIDPIFKIIFPFIPCVFVYKIYIDNRNLHFNYVNNNFKIAIIIIMIKILYYIYFKSVLIQFLTFIFFYLLIDPVRSLTSFKTSSACSGSRMSQCTQTLVFQKIVIVFYPLTSSKNNIKISE